MDPFSAIYSLIIILIISIALIYSGIKKQPGIGILITLLAILLTFWLRRNLVYIGLQSPANWLQTILLALLLGTGIQLLAVILIEPLSERITKKEHDYSVLESIKGNTAMLVQIILAAWILAAFLEEAIFRGFLMHEVLNLFGTNLPGALIAILLSSLIFSFSHWYQGPAGLISTGVIGLILAILFVLNNYNLWLLIFTHGFIDTIGLILISNNTDRKISKWFWKA
jgi:membrane protease YdiL (CAAX protease family)